jgi:anti-anti-sigma factor
MAEYHHITTRSVGPVLILSIGARQLRTPETCYAVRDELQDAVTHTGATRLVLDLGAIESIGSIGLLVFLGARRLPTVDRIVLCNLSKQLEEVLLLSRLLSSDPGHAGPFERAATIEDAVKLADA